MEDLRPIEPHPTSSQILYILTQFLLRYSVTLVSAISPALQVFNLRYSRGRPHNDPNNLLVPIIDLLMFPVRRDQRPISRLEILPRVAVLVVRGRDQASVPADGVHDRVLAAVVVHGRGAVRVGAHQGPADRRGEIDYGGLPLHTLRLPIFPGLDVLGERDVHGTRVLLVVFGTHTVFFLSSTLGHNSDHRARGGLLTYSKER